MRFLTDWAAKLLTGGSVTKPQAVGQLLGLSISSPSVIYVEGRQVITAQLFNFESVVSVTTVRFGTTSLHDVEFDLRTGEIKGIYRGNSIRKPGDYKLYVKFRVRVLEEGRRIPEICTITVTSGNCITVCR